MPLPMVHFGVAVDLATRFSRLLTTAFLVGSIAPDAIHARPGATRIDKNRTHLLRAPHEETIDTEYVHAVGEFVRGHKSTTVKDVEFVAGYAAHLLTDRLWYHTVYRSFRERSPNELSPAERTKLYYQETDQVDLDLYRRQVWRPVVWSLLEARQSWHVDGLLTAAEIEAYTAQKLAWYPSNVQAQKLQPQFIALEQVIAFMTQAGLWITEQFADWQRLA